MTTLKVKKRYSSEDAEAIIAKFKEYSFDDLRRLFREGKAPSFDEIEGDTAGGFLVFNPKTEWWRKAASAMGFDNPLARWAGKRFISTFEGGKKGKGTNLFRNRLFPQRFGINISIEESLSDQKPCLEVTYPYFPSSLFGVHDELRKIDEGIFLGQAYHRLPWSKEYLLEVYFLLCALNRSG